MFWIRRTQVINLTVVGFLRCFGLVLLSMLPFGCIEEVEIPIAKGQELLVVDGRITNECGPHVIHITRSARYGDVFTGTIRAEQRAQVIIRDSRGGRTALAETIPGYYETPADFQGVVGETYILQITTRSGKTYASLPETILPPVPMDSLIARFVTSPSDNPLVNQSGIELYASFEDPLDERNLYLWEVNGIYERQSCFIEDKPNASFLLANDADFGSPTQISKVAYIGDDGKRFTKIYYAEVAQYAVSPEAFTHFDLLSQITSIDGDLFDAPPAGLNSNIINLDDPNEPTIGYFGAFGVSHRSIFLRRSFLEEPQPVITFIGGCANLRNTTGRPAFWID